MKEMIWLFIKNTPEYIEHIKEFNEQKEWLKLKEEAHKLKPTLSYMGIEVLLPVIKEIENNAQNQVKLDSIPLLLKKLEKKAETAIEQLKKKIDGL